MQHRELRSDRYPWFIDRLFKHSYTYISNFIIAGHGDSHGASSSNEKWEYE